MKPTYRRFLALLLPFVWEPVAMGLDHDGLYQADHELGAFYRASDDPEGLVVLSKGSKEGPDGIDEVALQEMVRNMVEADILAQIRASNKTLVAK